MFKLFYRLMEAAEEGADGGEGDGGANRQALETKAKGMGWVPKAEWNGSPGAWTDAEEYIQRGEQIMPLLRATNRKLEDKLSNTETELQKTRKLLAAATESIQVLTQMNTKTNRDAAKEKRRELMRAQAQARKDDNTELEITIGEQIEEVTQTISEAEASLEETPVVEGKGKGKGSKATNGEGTGNQVDPMSDPDYRAWAQDNPWFGSDEVKTAAATAVGRKLRKAGDTSTGRAFFDKVTVEVNKIFEPHRRTQTKVDGGGSGNGGGGGGEGGSDGGGGRSFNDLPSDAKAVCKRQTGAMVGEGRAFKTEADWKKYYAEHYKWD